MISPRGLYGVIGDPVAHSLSPTLHNAAFQAWGLPAAMFAWRIPPHRLSAFVDAARLLPVTGACVTLPHKSAILPMLDRITPLAASVGAANTLYWDEGELVGHNTDVDGFTFPLYARPAPSIALILGAGGAARAVLAGLLGLPGVERILVCARREEQARELTASVHPLDASRHGDDAPTPLVSTLPWNDREDVAADLVVNATPLGLNPDAPSPFRFLRKAQREKPLAYDLVYSDTTFLEAGRAAGWDTLDGRAMFLHQAEAQFTLWTGFPLPDAARAALEQAYGG